VCGSVVFNYDSAPATGCALGDIDRAVWRIDAHPNPVQSTLLLKGDVPDGSLIELLDLTGTRHEMKLVANALDLSHLDAGFYLLRIAWEGAVIVTDKVIVAR
jgi:hypothetical protein